MAELERLLGDLKSPATGTKVVVYTDEGSFGFDTWASAFVFVQAQAAAEAAIQVLNEYDPHADCHPSAECGQSVPNSPYHCVAGKECHTCLDNGCGEPEGDEIGGKTPMCDGDCGDGCKRARPVDTRWAALR